MSIRIHATYQLACKCGKEVDCEGWLAYGGEPLTGKPDGWKAEVRSGPFGDFSIVECPACLEERAAALREKGLIK